MFSQTKTPIQWGGGLRTLLAYPVRFAMRGSVLIGILCVWLLWRPGIVLAQNCNDWYVEVCPTQLPIAPFYSVPDCPDGCYRVYYYFYLTRNGGDVNVSEDFSFTHMYIRGNLSVLSTPGESNGQFSHVNVSASENCSPEFPGLNKSAPLYHSPILSYDRVSREFVWEASSNNPEQPRITWPVHGRLLLFVLAVDVFPEDIVKPTGMSYAIVFEGPSPACPLTTVQHCVDEDAFYKHVAQPSNSCNIPPVLFRIGNPQPYPSPAYPNRRRLPVFVSNISQSQALIWDKIDFLVNVNGSVSSPMGMPAVEGGLIPASSLQVRSLFGQQYRIYASHEGTIEIPPNASSPTASNTLYYIVLNGPLMESQCMTASVSFPGKGRVDGGLYSCCKPIFPDNAMPVTWGGSGCIDLSCPTSTLMEASIVKPTQQQACSGRLTIELKLTASYTIDPIALRAVLKVQKTGDFELDLAGSEINVSGCTPLSSCLSAQDVGDYFRITFNAPDITQLNIPANQTFTVAKIVLNTETAGCVSAITFLDAMVHRAGGQPCIPNVSATPLASNPDDDVCAAERVLEISAERYYGGAIDNWYYHINNCGENVPSNCSYIGNSPVGQTVSHCVCALPNQEQRVLIKKNDDPLNGVSTFDLVLINKHILGVELFDNGFKHIAADASRDNKVTTLDMVEIRKLILGIYTTFPMVNSWRFFDKTYKQAIENTLPPFPIVCDTSFGCSSIDTPDTFCLKEFVPFQVPFAPNAPHRAEFVCVKVGDVNNTASPFPLASDAEERYVTSRHLGTRPWTGRSGDRIEIPVFATERQTLAGWQLGLTYDTALLRVTGIRWAYELKPDDVENYAWHLPALGDLRLLWFSGFQARTFEAGQPLFFVQAELKQAVRRPMQLLFNHTNSIPSEAYDAALREHRWHLSTSDLALRPPAPEPDPVPECRLSALPNPSKGSLRLHIEASASTEGILVLYDALGRVWHEQPIALPTGLTVVPLPSSGGVLPAGQYIATLRTPHSTASLRIVRQ